MKIDNIDVDSAIASVKNLLEKERDAVKELKVDRRSLPKGRWYQEDGYETRQVIDIDIARFVTEYRAQVIKDDQGNRCVAAFPDRVSRPVQYGIGIKANAVYMSQFQRLPYDRIRDHFQEQMGIPVSAGSVFNFNKKAYEKLDHFEQWAKAQLAKSELMQQRIDAALSPHQAWH
ncbi:Transposase [Marinobacter sp. ELB17]|nr:Transposase [Marinobacter sp. ELB17]